jgi:hypothetical protein|eukprot:COSAG02_NODE_447_length_22120_cov_32.584170_5_plen_257_part_00
MLHTAYSPRVERTGMDLSSQNSLVAPLTKEGTTSVLRPSHHKQPVKRKTAGQVSKAQIQAQIEESATGLTIGEEASSGKRKRKRPPQLTEALGGDGPRSSRRRGDGRIFSPSEFAPINALGQLEVCGWPPFVRRLLASRAGMLSTAQTISLRRDICCSPFFLFRLRWTCQPLAIRRGARLPDHFGRRLNAAQRPGIRRVPSTDRRYESPVVRTHCVAGRLPAPKLCVSCDSLLAHIVLLHRMTTNTLRCCVRFAEQ